MKIHYLQHETFEGLAHIETWARQRGHRLSSTQLYQSNHTYPAPAYIDWLIVMGGSMGTYEEDSYPWLREEKAFIKACIEQGKIVLGICLGAQLIAEVLGARVYQNPVKEIGWLPLQLTEEGQQHALFKDLPPQSTVFHWHGDTFGLPEGATRLAQSEGCLNQAFVYGDRVLGLQFHCECTPESVSLMVEHGAKELQAGQYVQSADTIKAQLGLSSDNNRLLESILEKLEAMAQS